MEENKLQENKLQENILQENKLQENKYQQKISIDENTNLINKNCRICFDNNLDQNDIWLAPCKCIGDRKFVHRKCLNEWRATSTRENAFTQCEICQTQFKTKLAFPLEKSFCNKFMINLITNFKFFYYLSIQVILTIISIILYNIDYNKKLFHIFNLEDDPISVYYFLSNLILVIYMTLFFLCNFFIIRNKSLYIKEYFNVNYYKVSYIVMLMIVGYFINLIIGSLIMSVSLSQFSTYHYNIIEKINKANNIEVLNY